VSKFIRTEMLLNNPQPR